MGLEEILALRLSSLLFVLSALLALPLVSQAQKGDTPAHSHPADTGKPIKCPRCNHENRPSAKFCSECGVVLRPGGCPRCGAALIAGEKFCTECGLDLNAATPHQPLRLNKTGEPAQKEETPTPDLPPNGDSSTGEGYGGLKILGFGDIHFTAGDQKGTHNSFALGQTDLFITSQLNDKTSVLNENVIEPGTDNAFAFSIERLIIQYQINNIFDVGVGRYHTSIGYYNTAYHHGTWLQTTVGKPFMFGKTPNGGILPTHNVGMTLRARVPNNKLGLQAILEVGNGRTSHNRTDEPVQNRIDENNGKAVNLAITAKPDSMPGLQAGLSFYHDRLEPTGVAPIDQWIYSGHLVYQNPNFEWLNEALVLRHTPKGAGKTFDTPGFYTQVSKQFGKTRPYFRYEAVNAPNGDPIHGDVGLRHGPSLGVRYDLTDMSAFKLQWDRLWRHGIGTTNLLTLQTDFTF
jgi:hypothetical protein